MEYFMNMIHCMTKKLENERQIKKFHTSLATEINK